MTRIALLTGLIAASLPLAALAAKPPLYDDFSGAEIERSRWFETEAWRYTSGGTLHMGRWLYGGTAADSGLVLESFNTTISNNAAPKAFAATIKVTDIATNEGCSFNPSPSQSRARLIAAYFNVRPGGPVPNDQTGDVIAQIRLIRASNSVDPAGVLQVDGTLVECTNANCSNGNTLAFADLGTVATGTPVTAQIEWSKANNLFRFIRDKTQIVDATYTAGDGTSPAVPFVNLSLRNEAANCFSAQRTKTGIAAEFDNVRITQ
ncbi:MAG: hypothetical protein IV094_03220 [Vitreoscilla sp.]|nr:hypothetical protein [Vitreoscilla sp.]